MRLLIGGSSSFLFHLKEFSDTLNKLGVESKLVFEELGLKGLQGEEFVMLKFQTPTKHIIENIVYSLSY